MTIIKSKKDSLQSRNLEPLTKSQNAHSLSVTSAGITFPRSFNVYSIMGTARQRQLIAQPGGP